MRHPWFEISIADYEAHMAPRTWPKFAQSQRSISLTASYAVDNSGTAVPWILAGCPATIDLGTNYLRGLA
jgi:hypothetical protein